MDFITYEQAKILFYFSLSILVIGLLVVTIIGNYLQSTGVKLFSDGYKRLNEFNKICFHISTIVNIAIIVIILFAIIYIIKGGI